jgi:catechol 2,3-dioxygenase-like lactoylglutathione lyase family enzyme
MAIELVRPRLGWDMKEGILVEWRKRDGDTVEVGEIVFTVETEKALHEVEALDAGVLRIPPDSPEPGAAMPVGTLLAYLVAPGEKAPFEGGAAPRKMAPAVSAADPPASSAVARERSVGEPAEKSGEDGPRISPRARRMAEDLGIDWRVLRGSGREGRIVERDVEAAMGSRNPAMGSSSWRLSGFHHLGLTVRDIERSIVFYRDVLGMELLRRRETDADYIGLQTGYRGVRLAAASFRPTPDSPQSMEVVQYLTHAGEAADPATNRAGNSHLCLTVDDLGVAYRALRERGVKFRSEPVEITSGPNQGGLVIYLYDPDGYTIELFQPKAAGE